MLEQLRELRDRKGYDVSAIIAIGDGKLGKKLEQEGIPFRCFDFDFPSMKGWSSLLSRVIELARLLRHERYDVVQTHLFASMVLGRLAAWLADVPVRFAMIAGPYHLEAHTPRWIDRATWWMETGLIASCEYTRTLYTQMGVPRARISRIYYGPDATKFDHSATQQYDLKREYALPPESQVVAMVAYFYPRLPVSSWTPLFLHDRANKRQEDLIRAAPLILRDKPDVRILLVGSGWTEAGEQEAAKAKQLATDLNLGDRVIFAGYRNDVNSILSSVDVAVQASLSENLGGTIEALLMECPIVATRTGGLVDSVRDGETGVLVEPLDPQDLARGVLRVLKDPADARRMATNGRRLMLEAFTLDRTVEALDCLYLRELAKAHRGYRWSVSGVRAIIALPVFARLALQLAWDMKYQALWTSGWRPFPFLQLQAVARKLRAAIGRGRAKIRRLTDRATSEIGGKQDATSLLVSTIPRTAACIRSTCIRLWTEALPRTRTVTAWLRLQPLYAYGYVRYLLRNTALLGRWDVFFAWIRGRKPL
jgi:glycosyltransferase involved in cell wall biosynthesis